MESNTQSELSYKTEETMGEKTNKTNRRTNQTTKLWALESPNQIVSTCLNKQTICEHSTHQTTKLWAFDSPTKQTNQLWNQTKRKETKPMWTKMNYLKPNETKSKSTIVFYIYHSNSWPWQLNKGLIQFQTYFFHIEWN